jgi:hypothetical protein
MKYLFTKDSFNPVLQRIQEKNTPTIRLYVGQGGLEFL